MNLKHDAVVIVGRPNVGKSSLFNRLVGKRLAVVHGESGTTRDRLESYAEWYDRKFRVLDTGGLPAADGRNARSEIEMGIGFQIGAALDQAAAAIFVTDTKTGATPLDEEVAGLLRRRGIRAFVAANKADNEDEDLQAVEFERFGFPVFPVSALHNRGFEELMEAVLGVLPEDAPGEKADDALKVAIVGRPNVGKSCYINRLLRHERVIVSDIPGTTRDAVEVPFSIAAPGSAPNRYLLVDTPGIRHLGRSVPVVERFSMMRTEAAIERADLIVAVVDGSCGITAQDRRILGGILDRKKGCVLLCNKWDLSTVTQRKFAEGLAGSLKGMNYVPVEYVSAKTGYNIRRSLDRIERVSANIKAEVATPALNRAIAKACARLSPPLVNDRRLKIYYATQTGVMPVRFTLFVNEPGLLKRTYETYLAGYLREGFGLEGAPIVFELRARSRSART